MKPESLERSRMRALDGAVRYAEFVGNTFLGQVEVVAKDDDLALSLGQATQQLHDFLPVVDD